MKRFILKRNFCIKLEEVLVEKDKLGFDIIFREK
jgi:hypothetical protein